VPSTPFLNTLAHSLASFLPYCMTYVSFYINLSVFVAACSAGALLRRRFSRWLGHFAVQGLEVALKDVHQGDQTIGV